MVKLIKINESQKKIVNGVVEYGKLREKMERLGVFDRSYGYYYTLALFAFGGLFVTGYLIYLAHGIPLLIILGVLFSFFAVQIAGMLHDAGHRAIFKSNKMNDLFGLFCGIVLAMGYSSWKAKHNMHHAHPNQEDTDPDVSIPLLSFTPERYLKKRGIAYWIRRYQSYLYFPVGTLVGFSVRGASIKYFFTHLDKKNAIELGLVLSSIFVWFILPFFIFEPQKSITLFIVVNISIGFYLLNVFAPNHKGMPQFAKGVKISFMEQQIMTSRNIYGNLLTDFIYMGLNYQIEHHLFPNTPRNKLKKITPYVIAYCRKHNLEFTRTGIIESNRIILSELHQIAVSTRPEKRG